MPPAKAGDKPAYRPSQPWSAHCTASAAEEARRRCSSCSTRLGAYDGLERVHRAAVHVSSGAPVLHCAAARRRASRRQLRRGRGPGGARGGAPCSRVFTTSSGCSASTLHTPAATPQRHRASPARRSTSARSGHGSAARGRGSTQLERGRSCGERRFFATSATRGAAVTRFTSPHAMAALMMQSAVPRVAALRCSPPRRQRCRVAAPCAAQRSDERSAEVAASGRRCAALCSTCMHAPRASSGRGVPRRVPQPAPQVLAALLSPDLLAAPQGVAAQQLRRAGAGLAAELQARLSCASGARRVMHTRDTACAATHRPKKTRI